MASLGIASFLGLNAGNLLGGWNQNRCGCQGSSPDDQPINRYEAKMMQEAAAKDSKIALLESQVYVDGKLKETIEYLLGETRKVENEVRANKDMQCEINKEQAVYNGVNTATLNCIQNQVTQLFGITKLVVPVSAVCPQPAIANPQPATTPTT